jgi:phage N-6-adenine-methyltransferase
MTTTRPFGAGFSHENYGNTNVEWYTPPWVFQALGMQFDLDPCHPVEPLAWVDIETRYTIHDDGLSKPWAGRVWLNPPYGKHTAMWLERMHCHRNGVSLLFARTDCSWFHESVAKADAILFLRGRVRFVDGQCVSAKGGAGAGSMLVAWGKDNVAALMRMRDYGHLVLNQ